MTRFGGLRLDEENLSRWPIEGRFAASAGRPGCGPKVSEAVLRVCGGPFCKGGSGRRLFRPTVGAGALWVSSTLDVLTPLESSQKEI